VVVVAAIVVDVVEVLLVVDVTATVVADALVTAMAVVDVVDAVRRQFASSPVRFIHVEVFQDNDPATGYNRWMKQWGLRSEPWTFVVGRDGRVKAKFEGSGSASELAAAVRRASL